MIATRILLADPHKMFREGVKQFLANESSLAVIGEASNGRETIDMADSQRPDLVILELMLEHINGANAISHLRRLYPGLVFIGLSSQWHKPAILQAFRAGVSGYVLKLDSPEILLEAIRATLEGEYYLSPTIDDQDIKTAITSRNRAGEAKSKTLTLRETEILQLVTEGQSTKKIAAFHHISTRTVETHRQRIMKKLGIDHLPGLTKYALKEGLTNLDY